MRDTAARGGLDFSVSRIIVSLDKREAFMSTSIRRAQLGRAETTFSKTLTQELENGKMGMTRWQVVIDNCQHESWLLNLELRPCYIRVGDKEKEAASEWVTNKVGGLSLRGSSQWVTTFWLCFSLLNQGMTEKNDTVTVLKHLWNNYLNL